jgi:hypothetical protein
MKERLPAQEWRAGLYERDDGLVTGTQGVSSSIRGAVAVGQHEQSAHGRLAGSIDEQE